MPHLSDSENIDWVQMQEQAAAPTTPAAGYGRVFYKNDDKLWFVDDAGNERELLFSDNLDGADVANVVEDQTTPGIPVIFPVAIAGGAAGDTDITIVGKHRVIDVWAQHTGGAGEASDTIQVKNGANAITDAMDWSGADKAIVRAGEIDDANYEIADAGTLRVTTTDNDAEGDVGAGVVYVLAIPVS